MKMSGIESVNEYEVISSLINQKYSASENKMLAIEELTQSFKLKNSMSAAISAIKGFSLANSDLIEDFRIKNEKICRFMRKFKIDREYILLKKREKDRIFGSGIVEGWKRFYEEYPGACGMISFSRAGLNKEKNLAVVFADNSAGAAGCEGKAYLLKKNKGIWKIISECITFVS